ncbi:MAG: FG-GAP-like repeat-containing protein [Gammaproteobacteria bacterium]|nr:FG-GAP-like repeat-containing protein [Gammaproteobacteria bacterium]
MSNTPIELLLALVAILVVIPWRSASSAELLEVDPPMQRVHELITLRGSGFGDRQEDQAVIFTDGTTTIRSGKAYLWRDDFIQIRVPVGNRIGTSITPIPKTPLLVAVDLGARRTNYRGFRVITSALNELGFRQLTEIDGHRDISMILGDPNMNLGRSKDAEVADVNGDGFEDIFDNNSNNDRNASHSVLRLNNLDKRFTAMAFDPLNDGETGSFAAIVPSGGDFFEDHASYDADFVDINNDGLPDLVQTAANNFTMSDFRIRIFMNNDGGVPGRFIEDSAARLPSDAIPDGWCPDDFDHADIDNDGNLDFLVTLRTAPFFCPERTSQTRVFRNAGDGRFIAPIVINAPDSISTHDSFFLDANTDGFEDVLICNEWNLAESDGRTAVESQLFLHNADADSPEYSLSQNFPVAAATGAPADFNGDGIVDFVIGAEDVRVFINDAATPGNFSSTRLPGIDPTHPGDPFYDLELGDLNLDGSVDIVGTRTGSDWGRNADRNVWIWLNRGDGTFADPISTPSSTVLPGNGPYQRLSADLLDFDRDGDLDLYLAGADTQDVVPRPPTGPVGLGRVPNQFYENLVIGLHILSPEQGEPAWGGSSSVGNRILVRLLGGSAGIDLSPGNVALSVDGEPVVRVITEATINGEYWMLVETPPRSSGCYALDAVLRDDPAIRDREPNSVCYRDTQILDRAVAVDRTNSMIEYDRETDTFSDEKIEAARAAGRFFVNLSNDQDRIGVVSFKRDSDDGDEVVEQDELARTDFRMVQAQPDATTNNREPAARIIGNLRPDGEGFPLETSIGAGLTEAWDMLRDPAQGDPTHQWEIVLISDGRENFAPFWEREGEFPLKPQLDMADPSVRVHTVAIGQDADVGVLFDIANTTGGIFWDLLEGRGSYGLMSRLASVYKEIDERQRDEQRFYYREGIPPEVRSLGTELTHLPAPIPTGYIPVAEGFQVITVAFHWNRDDGARVVLRDPTGSIVSAAPPGLSAFADSKHQIYRVVNPAAGLWSYNVYVQDREPDLEFFAAASGIGELVMRTGPTQVDELTPGRYGTPLRVVLGDFRPIHLAIVRGTVRRPDRIKVPIILHDDGAHHDGAAGDGIYGTYFEHDLPGAYLFSVKANGTSSRGEPFKRYASFSFVFGGTDADDPGPSEIPGQLERPWSVCGPYFKCALIAALIAALLVAFVMCFLCDRIKLWFR